MSLHTYTIGQQQGHLFDIHHIQLTISSLSSSEPVSSSEEFSLEFKASLISIFPPYFLKSNNARAQIYHEARRYHVLFRPPFQLLIGREGLVPISAPAFLVQRRHPRVFSKLKGLVKFRSVFENMGTGFSNLEILQEPESRADQLK